ncbi:MAG: hypothetical protein HY909_05565 [Deltaproteobacteria bacterium]|nr:hypothetical protein [Deltaproteobacteria bacterium]
MAARTLSVGMKFLVGVAVFGGCGPWVNPAEPRVEPLPRFTVLRSQGCSGLFAVGCPLDRPLLTGVHETINVRVPGSLTVGDVRVESTSPSVLSVDGVNVAVRDSTTTVAVDVTARATGATRLKVWFTSGSLVDQVDVRVADATSIEVVETDPPRLLSPDGGTFTLRMPVATAASGARPTEDRSVGSLVGWARDASGRLYGNDAVVWTIADPSIARLSWLFMGGAEVRDDRVLLQALRPGTTIATVRAGSVSRTVTVVVLP